MSAYITFDFDTRTRSWQLANPRPAKMLRKDFRVVNSEWGTKHTCDKCAARFYDLNRAPVVCPKCGAHQVDKALAKASAGAKTPRQEPRNTKPKVNDEAEQAMGAAETDNDGHDEEANEEGVDADNEDDVDDVLNIIDDADPAKG
jgi:uncharacterized protein (TIGR02300 family)